MASDLVASLAELDAAFMPDTCSISRNVAGTANGTPQKPDWQPVAPGTPVICRVGNAGSNPQVQEQLVALQLQGIQVYVLAVPLGTDLRRNDQVAVKGEAFQVIGTGGASSYSTRLEAIIKSVGATT